MKSVTDIDKQVASKINFPGFDKYDCIILLT